MSQDLDYRTGRASNLAEHETSIYLLDDANNSSDSEVRKLFHMKPLSYHAYHCNIAV